MSISYESKLIFGFILSEDEYSDEDKVEELAKKLKCGFAYFDSGYDTPMEYALVPKNFDSEGDIDLADPDALNKLTKAIEAIQLRADELGIELPSPVLTSRLFVC